MSDKIRKISTRLFSLLDGFFPTKKHIIFSCRAANDYADNAKYLFEYFLNKNEKVYFYTKNRQVLSKIPGKALYAYHWKTPFILLRSKVLVLTHGAFDFFPYFFKPNKKRTVINLFHAIPVKKIEEPPLAEKNFWNYFVVSSEFEKDFTHKNLKLNKDSIVVTGQPRNDQLKTLSDTKHPKKKRILFAPTFRDNDITQLFPFPDKDLKALDNYLKENNTSIAIRLHINEEKVYKKSAMFQNLTHIFFEGSTVYPDVTEVLPQYSAVITDYSSVYIDFLLLDRPVAFIPYDYTEYQKVRGFSFPYFDYTPGPKINTQEELKSFISNLSMGQNPYAEQAKKIKHIFHQKTEKRACEQLFNLIKEHAR
jgi:CDP-glycerol glycerophosphotransferase (TagB/SpsB family)